MIPNTIIIAIVVVGAYAAAQPPFPYCQQRSIFHEGPLALNERVLFDMDDAFTGYNLDIQIASETKAATIRPKFQELDRKDSYIADLISHHIQSKGN